MLEDFYLKMNTVNDSPETTRIRRIVECGLQATLLIILALVGSSVPFFGILAYMCYPAPILFISVRFGLREGFLASVASCLLISVLLNPFTAIRIFVLGVPIGLLLGYAFKSKWSYFRMICTASLLGSGLLILVMVGVSYILGDFLLSDLVLFPNFEEMPLFSSDVSTPEAFQNSVRQFFNMSWLTIVYVAGLMMVIPAVLWNATFLQKLGSEVPEIPQFSDFRLSKLFSFAYGISVITLIAGFFMKLGFVLQFGYNLHLIMTLFGFVAGAALYFHYTKLYNWHFIIKYFVFFAILSIAFVGECFVWIGLLDPIFDFRTRFKGKHAS